MHLYKELRRFIWDFRVVTTIADLEIACMETCPNLDIIRSTFNRLKVDVSEISREDDNLKKALDAFEDVIQSEESTYAKLYQVNERVSQ